MKLPFILSNKTYDRLMWVIAIVIPALAVFYRVLADTWGMPYADQITTTLSGLATFLGAVFLISNKNYYDRKYDEDIEVLEDEDE